MPVEIGSNRRRAILGSPSHRHFVPTPKSIRFVTRACGPHPAGALRASVCSQSSSRGELPTTWFEGRLSIHHKHLKTKRVPLALWVIFLTFLRNNTPIFAICSIFVTQFCRSNWPAPVCMAPIATLLSSGGKGRTFKSSHLTGISTTFSDLPASFAL